MNSSRQISGVNIKYIYGPYVYIWSNSLTCHSKCTACTTARSVSAAAGWSVAGRCSPAFYSSVVISSRNCLFTNLFEVLTDKQQHLRSSASCVHWSLYTLPAALNSLSLATDVAGADKYRWPTSAVCGHCSVLRLPTTLMDSVASGTLVCPRYCATSLSAVWPLAVSRADQRATSDTVH